MKKSRMLCAVSPFTKVLLTLSLFLNCVSAQAIPLMYDWTGAFVDGTGPFNNRDFSITFTILDPAVVDLSVTYTVDASLNIVGIGTYNQTVNVAFANFTTTTMSIVGTGFQNILEPGDSMYFGICTGGSCNDPILWNGDASNPVLFTGTFALGLDSSCSVSAPCNNAIANWFDGVGGSTTTPYQGTLIVSEVPVPAALWLFGSGLLGLVGIARRTKAV